MRLNINILLEVHLLRNFIEKGSKFYGFGIKPINYKTFVMKTFRSRAALQQYIFSSLTQIGIKTELAEELGQSISDILGENATADSRLIMPSISWGIQDEELDLLGALVDGAQAAVGAGFFLTPSTPKDSLITALTGIITASFQLVSRVLRKGVRLKKNQILILMTLQRANNGMTVDEITDYVNATDTELIDETIMSVLKSLQKIALKDGSIVALADVDSYNRWHSIDI